HGKDEDRDAEADGDPGRLPHGSQGQSLARVRRHHRRHQSGGELPDAIQQGDSDAVVSGAGGEAAREGVHGAGSGAAADLSRAMPRRGRGAPSPSRPTTRYGFFSSGSRGDAAGNSCAFPLRTSETMSPTSTLRNASGGPWSTSTPRSVASAMRPRSRSSSSTRPTTRPSSAPR